MNFEEVRERFLYRHQKRDLSKRKNKIRVIENPFQKSKEKAKHIDNNKSADIYSIEPRKRRDYSYSSNDDQFETYVPEKDKKNKDKYIPSKKSTTNYQGRRFVKLKETTEYSEEQYGSLRREKRPAPRKIMCVTEIMVDISDTESEEYDDTTSQEKGVKACETSTTPTKQETELPPSAPVETKYMLPPDKIDFMNNIRKRSQKRREKENEIQAEKQLSEDMVKKIYSGNSINIPYISDAIQKKEQK